METERVDVRRLGRSGREQIRRIAVRMFQQGESQVAIARMLGVRRPTVTRWVGKAESGQGLEEKRRGRVLGEGRRLTAAQETQIRETIVNQTPDQRELPFALWNARAVQALIKALCKVNLPARTVRLYLKRWGFTPQRPLKRAFEQDPVAVQQWRETEYPALVARAQAEGAEICWGDETAVASLEHYPRGYAPKGQTPVLVLSQARRERINLISAITRQGLLRFMLYHNTFTADVLITFLNRLIRDSKRKVFLVLDNLRVHHSLKVRTWLATRRDRIELCFLPRYAPELNPDEYLNADLKARMSAGEPVRDRDHLQRKVTSHLRSIQKQPSRVQSYFNANPIQYAA